jgi:hypothetical protein
VLSSFRAARRGFTLAEAVVALGVGGVVFGAFALVVARQDRAHADLVRRIRARAQMHEGAGALAAELRPVAPPAGDIPPGGARDSAIEFRATVGSGISCGLRGGALVVAFSSFVAAPDVGDTAWVYGGDAPPATWRPLAVSGASVVAPEVGACALLDAAANVRPAGRQSPRGAYSLQLADPLDSGSFSALAPVRVTRHVRYSLYRAPDGLWYLGRREWSVARGRFATIQPVSGPYRSYARAGTGASGVEFRYFDGEGRAVASGAIETDRIARAVIALRALPAPNVLPRPERDVATIDVAFRNTRLHGALYVPV